MVANAPPLTVQKVLYKAARAVLTAVELGKAVNTEERALALQWGSWLVKKKSCWPLFAVSASWPSETHLAVLRAAEPRLPEVVWGLWWGAAPVQAWAASLLWSATAEELDLYLLQLVQCLRRQTAMYNSACPRVSALRHDKARARAYARAGEALASQGQSVCACAHAIEVAYEAADAPVPESLSAFTDGDDASNAPLAAPGSGSGSAPLGSLPVTCSACDGLIPRITDEDVNAQLAHVSFTRPPLAAAAPAAAAAPSAGLAAPQPHYYPHLAAQPPLTALLITRACWAQSTCQRLFWLLTVESEGLRGDAFVQLRDLLLDTLSTTAHGRRWARNVNDQQRLLARTIDLYKDPALALSSVDQKVVALRALLTDGSPEAAFHDLITLPRPVSLPLVPSVRVAGMVGAKCSMFKSAKRPILAVYAPHEHDAKAVAPAASNPAPAYPSATSNPGRAGTLGGLLWRDSCDTHTGFQSGHGAEYRSIFKCGDDLRQDQLVCQMFRLFDIDAQRHGLEAAVTNYNVVATTASTGWVEMVANSVTLEHIVHQHERDISKYLSLTNKSKKSMDIALSRILRSSAAYCVMTLVLGVGDRHMENIMVCQDGHLLHIDFGFLFGKDPKPLQPLIKLTREMVAAFGGDRSGGYVRFLEWCTEFAWALRQNASDYKVLVDAMVDAGLECFTDKLGTGLGVMKHLRSGHESEEEHEYKLVGILSESHNAVMGLLNDRIHTFAMSRK
jgi:phosphatidylinositol 3-kinase